jgi:hypothetical protein
MISDIAADPELASLHSDAELYEEIVRPMLQSLESSNDFQALRSFVRARTEEMTALSATEFRREA